MHSNQPGLIGQTKGWLTRRRFVGSLVFIDEFSDYTYVHHIEGFSDEETLRGKHCFENLMKSYDVEVKSYHADNGNFSHSLFTEDCLDKSQIITFCGVGAHHQSGIVERRIGDLTFAARTSLIHGQRLYNAAVTTMLWPFAFSHSARIRNLYYVGSDGLCPLERLTKVKSTHEIRNEHTLFCPTFMLNRPLQTNSKFLPKWDPRSTVGIYLGMSPFHASNVALFLDLKTGHVTPQYHLVFDDSFTTVEYLNKGTTPPFWTDLVRHNTEDFGIIDPSTSLDLEIEKVMYKERDDSPLTSDDDPDEAAHGDGPDDDFTAQSRNNKSEHPDSPALKPILKRAVRFVDEKEKKEVQSHEESDSISEGALDGAHKDPVPDVQASEGEGNKIEIINLEEAGLRRSTRSKKKINWYNPPSFFLTVIKALTSYRNQEDLEVFCQTHINYEGEASDIQPFAYNMQINNNEAYSLSQARKQEDWPDFCRAMLKEIEDHTARGHWILVKKSEIGVAPIIRSVWSFKRKRKPDGTLIKHKARLCAHGGMQIHGENYWETYSPVVKWMSIRTMLTIALIKKLHTRSIDFTLAFPQADVDVQIYMDIPYGFQVKGSSERHVLELKKNLYGLKQAGKTWFEYLSTTLVQDMGFTQSKLDQCVFYRDGMVFIVWVDDCSQEWKRRRCAYDRTKGEFHLNRRRGTRNDRNGISRSSSDPNTRSQIYFKSTFSHTANHRSGRTRQGKSSKNSIRI